MKQGKKKTRRPYRQFTALEKCEAVLSLWSERRKPAEICKELEVSWAVVNHWQDRALEGMLAMLEPRVRAGEKPPALTVRLEKLLTKKGKGPKEETSEARLEKRLETVQESKKTTP